MCGRPSELQLPCKLCIYHLLLHKNVAVSVAAEQRDERVKFILDADVMTSVKTFLTSVLKSRQLAVRLIAELVKTGTSAIFVLILPCVLSYRID